MRLGQKNPRVRQWARTGTRPLQFADQRTQSAYVFGAVAPQRGVGAALVMPSADRQAMDQHLAEISRHVTPGCHAIVVMDQAGWHTTAKLTVPDNISLLCLPPRSPELNPVEKIWQFLRQTYLSNRVFETYRAILDAGSAAWNSLMACPDTVRSIAYRDWAAIDQSP